MRLLLEIIICACVVGFITSIGMILPYPPLTELIKTGGNFAIVFQRQQDWITVHGWYLMTITTIIFSFSVGFYKKIQ
jgi:hypothetical protein